MIPTFYTAPDDGPRPVALAEGFVVALVVMAAMLFLMGQGGRRIVQSIGSRLPRFGLFEVNTGEGPSNLSTEVRVKAPPVVPNHGYLFNYFQAIRVLSAIDKDHDLNISDEEMGSAPSALRALDLDHDGRLSPEECGFGGPPTGPTPDELYEELMAFDRNHDGKLETAELPERLRGILRRAGPGADGRVSAAEVRRLAEREGSARKGIDADPEFVRKSRVWFMRVHTVLAALDTDADGVLSPVEIATAASALRSMDWNHDGYLTSEELLPDPVINALAYYFVRGDADGDGRITKAEAAKLPAALRETIAAADRSGDGATVGALRNELRRRAITDGDGGAHQLEIAGTGDSKRGHLAR